MAATIPMSKILMRQCRADSGKGMWEKEEIWLWVTPLVAYDTTVQETDHATSCLSPLTTNVVAIKSVSQQRYISIHHLWSGSHEGNHWKAVWVANTKARDRTERTTGSGLQQRSLGQTQYLQTSYILLENQHLVITCKRDYNHRGILLMSSYRSRSSSFVMLDFLSLIIAHLWCASGTPCQISHPSCINHCGCDGNDT